MMLQALLGSSGGSVNFYITSYQWFGPGASTGTVTLTLNTDGSMPSSGNSTENTVALSTGWFTPTTSGIGSSYWCKLVKNSGISVTGSALNSVLALSTARSWTMSAAVGNISTGNYTLTIYSDSGGTVQVASSTFNWEVDNL